MTIKEARIAARYSQEAAARKLGISRPTYKRLEEHPELVKIGQAQAIADLFGVSLDELFFLEAYYK